MWGRKCLQLNIFGAAQDKEEETKRERERERERERSSVSHVLLIELQRKKERL